KRRLDAPLAADVGRERGRLFLAHVADLDQDHHGDAESVESRGIELDPGLLIVGEEVGLVVQVFGLDRTCRFADLARYRTGIGDILRPLGSHRSRPGEQHGEGCGDGRGDVSGAGERGEWPGHVRVTSVWRRGSKRTLSGASAGRSRRACHAWEIAWEAIPRPQPARVALLNTIGS